MRRMLPLLLLLCVGCKGEPATHPVEGFLEIQGRPAEGFVVEFRSEAEETKGLNASGIVGADGKFTLKTMMNGKEKDGAVAGTHKVVVVSPPAGKRGAALPLPPKYEDYATTPLTFEVNEGANVYRVPVQ